jgi:parallel beta-helix repeat protein
MVLNSSSIWAFNGSSNYSITHYGDAVINITLNNETGALNPNNYADIAFLEAIYYSNVGLAQNSSFAYTIGQVMFDGNGLKDTVFQGQYQTYKLALYIYASIILDQQFPLSTETTLLKMQAASGGFYTGYDQNYSTNGTNTNVETTSLAILALTEINERTITINADGSMTPSTAPITTSDNITYTFTANIINKSIIVQRDNIVLNGAGFIIQGDGTGNGIDLSNRNNVTIENTNIETFQYGTYLENSSDITITKNNITANNYDGIFLYSSLNNNLNSNNITGTGHNITTIGNILTGNSTGIAVQSNSNNNNVSGNTLTSNIVSILLDSSCNDSINGNTITNNSNGVCLYSSANNSLNGNNITANSRNGIFLDSSSNNTIFQNNFINNSNQIDTNNSTNAWDNGNTGNYWSDYLTKNPNATQIGNSSIENTPYAIDTNNTDHYPLTTQNIVPEFSTILILPMILTAMSLAIMIRKKKNEKTRARASEFEDGHACWL